MAQQKKRGKRLARLLRPGMELYFVFLFGFCLFTLLVGQYVLGIIQVVASSLLLAAYLLDRRERDRKLSVFAKKLGIAIDRDNGRTALQRQIHIAGSKSEGAFLSCHR